MFRSAQTSKFDELVNLIKSNKMLRCKTFSHKKSLKKIAVSKNNGDIDLYTGLPIDASELKYQVDHIFEVQCFAYVIASALYNLDGLDDGRVIFSQLQDQLVGIINADFNLNVTDQTTNLVKMNIFRDFIKKRKLNLSLVKLLRDSNFQKCIVQFCKTLRRVCDEIKNQLKHFYNELPLDDATKKYAVQKIINEFELFYQSMQIEDYDLLKHSI